MLSATCRFSSFFSPLFLKWERRVQAKWAMNSMLRILWVLSDRYNMCSQPAWLLSNNGGGGTSEKRVWGVLSYSSSSMAVGSRTERHLTMECSTGVFLWSETFNAVLTRPSFSVPRRSSHCKEWLFSSHLISHGFRLASGAAFPFSLAFRFGECWGFFYSWCVLQGWGTLPRRLSKAYSGLNEPRTRKTAGRAEILSPESRRSFSWGNMPAWRHCHRH